MTKLTGFNNQMVILSKSLNKAINLYDTRQREIITNMRYFNDTNSLYVICDLIDKSMYKKICNRKK